MLRIALTIAGTIAGLLLAAGTPSAPAWAQGASGGPPASGGQPQSTTSEISDVIKVPGLSPEGKKAYQAFLQSGHSRAFAVGPGGGFGASAEQPDRFTAMAAAMWQCTRASRARCKVYAANDDLVLPDYAEYSRYSARALSFVRAAKALTLYANEIRDTGIPPQKELRRDNFHQPTPLTVPGAKTILTRDLVLAMQRASAPVLIDVLPQREKHQTLPDAVWLRSAGNYFGAGDAEATRLLGDVLARMVPAKESMLVFFCESPECWLSYNATLRAVSLGYTNVHWYRGGMAAWQEAKLPAVQAILDAQF